MSYIDKDLKIYNNPCDIRVVSPIFECDELIAPVISILNSKGFKTKYCCSGHINSYCHSLSDVDEINNDNCYIAFDMTKDELISNKFTLPEGFEFEDASVSYGDEVEFLLDDDLYKCLIRKKYDLNSDIDLWIQILDTMKHLFEWANGLPDISSLPYLWQ